jgi:RNA polymerase sigma-70 factor, ECF subfamily
MADQEDSDVALIGQARAGDQHALAELSGKHRKRLRRMVGLRLDRRLQGRIDPSDALQEAFLDIYRRQSEYVTDPKMPPFRETRT